MVKFKCSVVFLLFCLFSTIDLFAQKNSKLVEYEEITTGAQQTGLYLPLLKNKKIAVVAHQSSLIGNNHLVDSLLLLGVKVESIFCPEHGFRGNAEAGAMVDNEVDAKTGIPIISLYGKHKKPTAADLANIDIVIFDLQDVGVRFYTYVSTMTYVLGVCAEQNIPVIILDRPNPNGFLIDGPVLDLKHKSFVGMHEVPIAHGMTLCEYALMAVGQQWFDASKQLDLTVVPMQNYNHDMIVKLPINPSPNLPTWQAVYLYPSLCLFEGTEVSVGRGTPIPFEVYGSPDIMLGSFVFIPKSIPGASLHPKFEGQTCYGQNLRGYAENFQNNPSQLNLTWLISAYNSASDSSKFFNNFFEKLAGTDSLRHQIQSGYSEKEIKASWKKDLDKFKLIREKYLLYP